MGMTGGTASASSNTMNMGGMGMSGGSASASSNTMNMGGMGGYPAMGVGLSGANAGAQSSGQVNFFWKLYILK
jgi:hypothetical protein